MDKSIKFSTDIGKDGSTIQPKVLIGLGLNLVCCDSLSKELLIFLFNNLLCSDLKIIYLKLK